MNWIPTTEAELQELLDKGALEESVILELKREVGSKSLEVAKDIAAMANDGGVILYGVAEDDHGQPGSLSPFPLAGAAERIDAIVSTAISEPPLLEIKSIPSESEEGAGYLAVIVPPSIRAPHMVVVKGHNRFYGRRTKGNVPLTEGDVARLYERRQRAETDAEQLLEELISHAPPEAREGGAWLHLAARPMLRRETLVQNALPETRHPFDELIREANKVHLKVGAYSPGLKEVPARLVPDGWLLHMKLHPDGEPRDARRVLDLKVSFDGGLELFFGGAADKGEDSGPEVPEARVAGLAERFLRFAGGLYQRAGYLGQVVLGVVITGVRGAQSKRMIEEWGDRGGQGFEDDRFTRTEYVSAQALRDQAPKEARRLLERFFRALTQGQYDPFVDDQAD